jgi:hypothetical protein
MVNINIFVPTYTGVGISVPDRFTLRLGQKEERELFSIYHGERKSQGINQEARTHPQNSFS